MHVTTGPVAATAEHADTNMPPFCDAVRARGTDVESFTRRPDRDCDGRYGYDVRLGDGRTVQIAMPGLPVEELRAARMPAEGIWDHLRLYVDGVPWKWFLAVEECCNPGWYPALIEAGRRQRHRELADEDEDHARLFLRHAWNVSLADGADATP